jgi:hypothetical protein
MAEAKRVDALNNTVAVPEISEHPCLNSSETETGGSFRQF